MFNKRSTYWSLSCRRIRYPASPRQDFFTENLFGVSSSQRLFVFLASAGDCQILNVIATEVSKFEQTEEIFLYVLNLFIYITIQFLNLCYVTIIYSRNTFPLHHLTSIHFHFIQNIHFRSAKKTWHFFNMTLLNLCNVTMFTSWKLIWEASQKCDKTAVWKSCSKWFGNSIKYLFESSCFYQDVNTGTGKCNFGINVAETNSE